MGEPSSSRSPRCSSLPGRQPPRPRPTTGRASPRRFRPTTRRTAARRTSRRSRSPGRRRPTRACRAASARARSSAPSGSGPGLAGDARWCASRASAARSTSSTWRRSSSPRARRAPSTGIPNVVRRRGRRRRRRERGADVAVIALRVPAGRDLLVQAGRRGAPKAPEDELALLSLRRAPTCRSRCRRPATRADSATPPARSGQRHLPRARGRDDQRRGPGDAELPGARHGVAPLPARQHRACGASRVSGAPAAHAGRLPRRRRRRSANALDCVQPLGLRLDADARAGEARAARVDPRRDRAPPPAASARCVRVLDGDERVVDGGPGGSTRRPAARAAGCPTPATARSPSARASPGRELRGRVERATSGARC